MKTGTRWVSVVCDTEVMVVRGAEVALSCGGSPMVEAGGERGLGDLAPGLDGGSVLGKRYADAASGLQLLCVKAGAGSIAADGVVLDQVASKQLPSSD